MPLNPPSSVSVTQVSDTRADVSWAVDPGWTGVGIDRWDSWTGRWTPQVTLDTLDVTSWADTTLQDDRQYQWDVYGYDAAGNRSAAVQTGFITVAPNPPVNITLQRSGTVLTLGWKSGSSLPAATDYIYSTDAGTTWSAPVSVPDGTLTATITGTDPTLPYTVQLRGTYQGTSGPWSLPLGISAVTAPAAPTGLSPANDEVVQAGVAIPASWQHNPVDGTAETAHRVVYTINAGTPVDTGQVATGTTFSFPALASNDQVAWQVQTWGDGPDPSPLNDPPATFSAAANPTVAITSPAAGSTVAASTGQVSFTFGGGSTQVGGTITMRSADGSTVLASATFIGSGTTQPLPMDLANNTTYQLTVEVTDDGGLTASATVTFSVAFVPPPVPSLTITPSHGGGALTITVVNPAPGPTGTAAVSNRLSRKIGADGAWEMLSTSLNPNSSYTDYTAPVAGLVTYRAVAVSSVPTYSNTGDVPVTLDPATNAEYIFLSAGPGFSLIGRFRGNTQVKTAHSRSRTTKGFAGRSKPLSFTGRGITYEVDFSGVIEQGDQMSTEARFTAIQSWDGPVLYRDAWGRSVTGKLTGSLTFTEMPYNLQGFSGKVLRAKDGRTV